MQPVGRHGGSGWCRDDACAHHLGLFRFLLRNIGWQALQPRSEVSRTVQPDVNAARILNLTRHGQSFRGLDHVDSGGSVMPGLHFAGKPPTKVVQGLVCAARQNVHLPTESAQPRLGELAVGGDSAGSLVEGVDEQVFHVAVLAGLQNPNATFAAMAIW